MNEKKEVLYVNIEDIIPNRFQPRLNFNEKGMNELALSIKQHGIIQPLIVRKLADKYEIIAGERRYKAALLIGLNKIPVILSEVDDNKSAEMAVVENIQRKDMSPLEEAKSFNKILKSENITQEELAIKMGKSQASIANKLRLLNLCEEVQEALLEDKISERHARSLLTVKNVEIQKEILKEIIEKKLNVKLTEKLISEKTNQKLDKDENNLNFQIEEKDNESLKEEEVEENSSNPQLDILYNLNKEKEQNINVEEAISETKKEDLENINVEKPQPNIENLIKGTEKSEEKKEPENKNKFIEEDLSEDFFDINDFNQKDEKPEFKENINSIKEKINEIKTKGTKITYDEIDFEDFCKIIIKIEK